MNEYSIPEAIVYLADKYGKSNMPTSEETLRRAIRTKQLIAKEDGIPGRKGYRIIESDLDAFAESRLSRLRARRGRQQEKPVPSDVNYPASGKDEQELLSFPELFSRYIEGKITSTTYYQSLFSERMKWEKIMHEKQARLAQLNAQVVELQSEIQSCQSAIDAYSDGISKFQP